MVSIVQRSQDIACQHTAPLKRLILEQLKWEKNLQDLSYSPDIVKVIITYFFNSRNFWTNRV